MQALHLMSMMMSSGLGAALEIDAIMNSELCKEWGKTRIIVVEKMQPLSTYDPSKGFMYLVSELGLKFTDRHGLTEIVAEQGVDGSTLNGNRIDIDGSRSKFTFSFGNVRKPYWLPRHGFLAILEKAVQDRQAVELREGWEVTELRRVGDGEKGPPRLQKHKSPPSSRPRCRLRPLSKFPRRKST